MRQLEANMQHVTIDGFSIRRRSGNLTILVEVVLLAIYRGVCNVLLYAILHHADNIGHGCRFTAYVDGIHTNIGGRLVQNASNEVRTEPILDRIGLAMTIDVGILLARVEQLQNIGRTHGYFYRDQNIERRNFSGSGIIRNHGIVRDRNYHIRKRIGVSLV